MTKSFCRRLWDLRWSDFEIKKLSTKCDKQVGNAGWSETGPVSHLYVWGRRTSDRDRQ